MTDREGHSDDGPHSLESLSPRRAVEWYLEDRADELQAESLRTHRSTLDQFLRWTDEADLDDMNDLRGRDLQRFKTWRKQEGDLAAVSLNGQLAIVRHFRRSCGCSICSVSIQTAGNFPSKNPQSSERAPTS